MKYNELFTELLKEFEVDVALCVVQITTIQLSLKPKEKEIAGIKSFEERVLKRARDVLWEIDESVLDQSIEIWRVVHDWDIHNSMNGLGGCEKKTFKELLTTQ